MVDLSFLSKSQRLSGIRLIILAGEKKAIRREREKQLAQVK